VESATRVTLNWAELAGATAYKLYRSSDPDTGFTLIATVSQRTYTNQILSGGITYYYKLQGTNAQGDGVLSTGTPVKILPAPQSVQAQAATSEAGITLSWGAVTEASSYQVYRSTAQDTGFTAVGTTSSLSYTDGKLDWRTTYYYKIRALHTLEFGESPFSNQVSATTPYPPGITNLTYESVSGGAWTLQSDGSRKSPVISTGVTKARISFTNGGDNASITIQLRVSSYTSSYDYAFISTLDNAAATSSSGYYSGSRISGNQTVSITIPVSSPGNHFIDIGYQQNSSYTSSSYGAWFTVTNYSR
jgi:hypothetical protein